MQRRSTSLFLETWQVLMLTRFQIDGKEFTAQDEPLKLLALLRRHLDQTLDDSVYLTPDQLLSLKSWLLSHAEAMSPGKAIWIEESVNLQTYRIVAAIGKKDDGSTIVWHEPLPWPFGFANESNRL
jgi:hypothetical protein